MAATWREDRPVAITSASASEERPSRSMTTMSSALSSSSEMRTRSRSARSTASRLAVFLTAAFLGTDFLVEVLARLLADLALRGALRTPLDFSVSVHPPSRRYAARRCNLSRGYDADQALGETLGGPNGGRALRVALAADDGDRGRAPGAELRCGGCKPEALDRLGMQRSQDGTGTLDDGDGNTLGESGPTVPAPKDVEIVAAHEPDEFESRKTLLQSLQRVERVVRMKIVLEVHDDDPRMTGDQFGVADAIMQRRHSGDRLQGILRSDEPPDVIEPETFQRHFADMAMTFVGGVERAAEETDPQARRDRPRRSDPVGTLTMRPGLHSRTCPVPRTTYLNVVSCSTPTGPRACSLPVPIPISAPMPNSAPSANWVEAFHSTIAESSAERKRSAAALSSVTMLSVWREPYFSMCAMASSTPLTAFTAMTASRYSFGQSSSLARCAPG